MNTSIISSSSLSSRRVSALAGLAAGLTLGLFAIMPAYAVLGGAPMTPPDGATVSKAVTHSAASAVASAAGASASSSYTVRTTTLVMMGRITRNNSTVCQRALARLAIQAIG